MKSVKYLEFKELLESDDELPDDYFETPEIPAYKIDDRFETLEIPWLKDINIDNLYKKKPNLPILYTNLNDETVNQKTENLKKNEELFIERGVLNQQDIFCLKCIETLTTDATLLWFMNFLIYKDLQSNYKFLRSCLVDNFVYDVSNKYKSDLCNDMKRHNFKIIV